MRRTKSLLGVAAALSLWGAGAQAAPVTVYGDDLAFTYDDSSLFGTATVVGNTLVFSPTSFRAESANNAGTVLVSETLNIDVEVITPGKRIGQLRFFEAGDYYRSSSAADVRVSGYLHALSLTRTNPATYLPYFTSNVFNLGPGDLATTGASDTWAGGVTIDLASVTGWGSDTEVRATIQNNLIVEAYRADTAWVEKKAGAVGLEVTLVPVPAAVWLFGSGLIGLVAIARRNC